jgi:hypothetical protein
VKADLVSADEIGGSPVIPELTEPDGAKELATAHAGEGPVNQRRAVFWGGEASAALFAPGEGVGQWPSASM